MKKAVNIFLTTLVFLFIIPVSGFSQDNKSHEIDLKTIAKGIINRSGTCALITLNNDGAPRARAMDHFPVEDDFTIWFGTNPNSRKVDQIKKDPRVTIYYLDSDASGYVVISGLAEIVSDQKKKDHYWKDEWNAFYPNNKEAYMLIKVIPQWMEILSPPYNVYNDTITWQPPRVSFELNDQ